MEDGSKWVGTLVLLVIVVIIGWPAVERMRNEITVYHMFCTKGRVNGVCTSEEQTANPTTYKAFPDLQSVVYWTGDGPPSRFTSCAVRDVSNWTCHYGKTGETGRVEYMMTDGNYSEYAEAPMFASTTLFYPVSRWRWWMVKLSELGGKRERERRCSKASGSNGLKQERALCQIRCRTSCGDTSR